MADREEGAAAPNQRQGATESATKPAATESRCSRTATFTYKLV